jgi:hypothetical protein
MSEDAISLLSPIEPLTFTSTDASMSPVEVAVYNAAIDAAIATIRATRLTGELGLVSMVQPLLDALATEVGGLKL